MEVGTIIVFLVAVTLFLFGGLLGCFLGFVLGMVARFFHQYSFAQWVGMELEGARKNIQLGFERSEENARLAQATIISKAHAEAQEIYKEAARIHAEASGISPKVNEGLN